MPIIATAGENKTYTPAPEGTHQAVCVDVIDAGWHANPFKDGAQQHKVDIAWQIEALRDDGKRFTLYKRYTLSLHEKATLRHDLESWRGKAFTSAELAGFDVEAVIGANCLINVQHKASPDGSRVYANVIAVMPLVRGMSKFTAEGYVRKVDQVDAVPDEQSVDDDSIPF